MQEIDILWLTAGLSCDGDTIAMTAATQPSIEDLVLGALPWTPKVRLHNPVPRLSRTATNSCAVSIAAAEGKLRPFILVVEGSIPDETNKQKATGLPSEPIPQPASRLPRATGSTAWRREAWAVVAAGTCAAYGGIHAMEGNPTGCMGLPDYLGWDWKSKAGIPIVCIPGCPVQPDNMTQTLLELLYVAAGRAPMIELDDCCGPSRCSARRFMKAATGAAITSRRNSPTSTGRASAS